PASPTQAFEAADVHASPAGTTPSAGLLPNGRVELRGMTLLSIISIAHGVPNDSVAGGPAWLDAVRFDITAKAPGAATQIALRSMLKDLLVERFHLSLKNGEKEMPVFALVLVKKGAAKKASGSGDPDCKREQDGITISYTCRNVTMLSLAERLRM